MANKRIETTTSRTAEMTCITRAASSLETNPHYHSDDDLAVRLLPGFFGLVIRTRLYRTMQRRLLSPQGMYEYVIARTKYVDSAFRKALADGFDQILLFGAGFDTRELRFRSESGRTRIFELDAPPTQSAKLQQYRNRHLDVPANVVFIAIDFDKESLTQKLDAAGFEKGRKSLFVLEGLLMYLESDSVDATFRTIEEYVGAGSRVVFDYIRTSVLRHENTLYGEQGMTQSVARAGEQWRFGIEPNEVSAFAARYGLDVSDHKDADGLEAAYFREADGRLAGRVNGTHCIVTATRQ